MLLNLYSARDKIADKGLCVFAATNDGMAIRENVRALANVVPLGDLELLHIGTFDDNTMEVKELPRRVIAWDSYKFPESPIKPNAKPSEVKDGKK